MMIIVTTKTMTMNMTMTSMIMTIVTTKTIMTTIPITLRSKEAKVVPADQKILIDAINKFQVMKKNKLFFVYCSLNIDQCTNLIETEVKP